jgi:hypothetical protein
MLPDRRSVFRDGPDIAEAEWNSFDRIYPSREPEVLERVRILDGIHESLRSNATRCAYCRIGDDLKSNAQPALGDLIQDLTGYHIRSAEGAENRATDGPLLHRLLEAFHSEIRTSLDLILNAAGSDTESSVSHDLPATDNFRIISRKDFRVLT